MPRGRRRNAEQWADKLQAEIGYCYNCQPRDEGETVWVMGEPVQMHWFLMLRGVPDDLQDGVASALSCGHCGTELAIMDTVGLKPQSERDYEARHATWRRRHEPVLADFVSWLEKYPLLGVHHRLGRRFMREIPHFPTRSWKATATYWRARAASGPTIPGQSDLGPPTEPPAVEGRFSHHGQVVFYLASDKQTAAAEAIGREEGIAWLQRYDVGPLDRILDLDPTGHPDEMLDMPILAAGMNWSRAHVRESAKSEWRPEYLLPRFIADCARSAGFQGIIYPSTQYYGACLVLFKWTKHQVRPKSKPKLFRWNRKAADAASPF